MALRKGFGERSSGCVLYGSCYGDGSGNPMEDVPGPKEKSPHANSTDFNGNAEIAVAPAQGVFHGLDAVTPELKEVLYALLENCQSWKWAATAADHGAAAAAGLPEADPELAQWTRHTAVVSGAELVLTSSALCARSFAALR